MGHRDFAQEYINLMAEVLRPLFSISDNRLQRLNAVIDGPKIREEVRNRGNAAKMQGAKPLLIELKEMIAEMNEQPCGKWELYAVALCEWMDQQITYADPSEAISGGMVSLYPLVPVCSNAQPVILSSLNTNVKETGVCVAPKFPVSMAQMRMDGVLEDRKMAMRGTHFGINDRLINVSYYRWNEKTSHVKHVILSERVLIEEDKCPPDHTKIGFSPITNRHDLLKTEITVEKTDGLQLRRKAVKEITDAGHVETRFSASWLMACEESLDVVFGPEMLATDAMVSVEKQGSKFMKSLLKQAAKRGLRPPRLTILPTHWKDGKNRLLIFDESGKHIGTQCKHIPYVSAKENYEEALQSPVEEQDILLIHLKNQHRIAIAICAEFLAGMREYVDDFLCAQLGATLILVPSYSDGEQDFVKALARARPYGTTVVWGNCCGAVPNGNGKIRAKIIGGCGCAGVDDLSRFGSEANCGFHCGQYEGCLFTVHIPTRVPMEKPNAQPPPVIGHRCQ